MSSADRAPLDIRFYQSTLDGHVVCSRCLVSVHAGDQSGHASWHVTVEGRVLRSAHYAGTQTRP